MSQYLLINRIQVQGANAVAGFTWGFPAITHFLGFNHNLSRKLQKSEKFSNIQLSGCAVIAHQHQVHTYGYNQFTQSRNSPYLNSHNKVNTPPVIEEGKMNMNVSLLIAYEGNVGNREEALIEWLNNTCICQRLAGGSILGIGGIQFFTVDDDEKNRGNLRTLIRRLLPGFVLQDRSQYLEDHFNALQAEKPDAELFDAWLDFIALKQQARPASNLINRHFLKQADLDSENEQHKQLLKLWQEHLDQPYEQENIPDDLKNNFISFPANTTADKKLLAQWQTYCDPDDKADADWEYVKKPSSGFLVPIMVGYKAISQVHQNHEVANTRDHETDVCFVEAVHSVGEWQGAHRIRDVQTLKQSLWHYDYQKHWYLCKQNGSSKKSETSEILQQDPNDDFT